MPKIIVKSAFNVLLSHSDRRTITPGVHEVDDEVASHWYVQEHSEPVEDEASDDTGAEGGEKTEPPAIDDMSDDQLREFIKARDGRYPHSATGRDKLLAAAKGDAAVSKEIEAPVEGAEGGEKTEA